jgi:beta-glucuronidase
LAQRGASGSPRLLHGADCGKKEFLGFGWQRVRVPVAHFPKDFPQRFLRFDGVARRAEVYVNGRHLKTHEFSYVGFEAVLPKEIASASELIVALRISNHIPERGIPDHKWNGWWNHAGIFRDVRVGAARYPEGLGFFPGQPIIIRTLPLDPNRPSAGWNCFILPTPLARERGLRLSVELAEDVGGRDRVWTAQQPLGAEGIMLSLPGDVAPWNFENPALHALLCELRRPDGEIVLRVRPRVGLRDLRIRGPQALLNNEPVRLLGVSYHELDIQTGYFIPREKMRAHLEDIKRLGCNFLRTAHYPGHPYLLDLCDELGLAVWEEIPAWKTDDETLDDDAVFELWAAPYLRAMIERDRHRPSVWFWSVGNEFDSDDPRVRGYIARAAALVRSLDPSRPVSFASDQRLDDISFDLVDVIGINEYYGWYYGKSEDLGPVLDELIARFPNKPLLVTEFGADAAQGWTTRAPAHSRRDHSEPHQVRYLETHLRQIFHRKRSGNVLGGCWWLYQDFDDPHRNSRHHPKRWWGVNLKGLISRQGERKAAYDAFRRMAVELNFLEPSALEAPPPASTN